MKIVTDNHYKLLKKTGRESLQNQGSTFVLPCVTFVASVASWPASAASA